LFPSQLKAARALVETGPSALAEAAGVNVNTIRNMEAKGSGILTKQGFADWPTDDGFVRD
jgi:hypothetical protein